MTAIVIAMPAFAQDRKVADGTAQRLLQGFNAPASEWKIPNGPNWRSLSASGLLGNNLTSIKDRTWARTYESAEKLYAAGQPQYPLSNEYFWIRNKVADLFDASSEGYRKTPRKIGHYNRGPAKEFDWVWNRVAGPIHRISDGETKEVRRARDTAQIQTGRENAPLGGAGE